MESPKFVRIKLASRSYVVPTPTAPMECASILIAQSSTVRRVMTVQPKVHVSVDLASRLVHRVNPIEIVGVSLAWIDHASNVR